ncbi:MAG: carboxypeptidase-like regulatory protein [Chitinophagaceae bacterium]|nr:carboxypeptidase-like regulatory protein [Chitinophagaceae bacterium]
MCMKKLLSITGILFLSFVSVNAQQKLLGGQVIDKQSEEPIPFSAAVLKINGRGALADSSGKFYLHLSQWPAGDTLVISAVGYKPILFPIPEARDSVFVLAKMEVLPPQNETVVKAKYNRALWFWKKIISNKPRNDRSRYNSYSYEIYNKLELDLNNVNKEKLLKNKLLHKFDFVLDYVDSTSEETSFLPVYLTETLSDFYFQKSPYRSREIIKATKTNGLDNESVVKQLGGTYQNINIYNNFIPVFDLQFIGPFHNNGDNYYNFKLLDTQYLSGKRLVHLRFVPKRKGENTFEGDCWIHDSDFAVQKITMRPSGEANINFIKGLSMIQEYRLINDTTWFQYKDRFVADIAPLGKSRVGFKGRKTTTYENVKVDDPVVSEEIAKNKVPEEIVLLHGSEVKTDSFWINSRHEELTKTEEGVYELLDTLENNRTFRRYRSTLTFLTTGTKDIGNFRIGPWYYWYSGNAWEGTRLGFDLATNRGFNKNLYLHGYAGYGFLDKQWKYQVNAKYMFSREPWSYLQVQYMKDFDAGVTNSDQLSSSNIFAFLLRKPNIPLKYQILTEGRIDYHKESKSGIAFGISAVRQQYDPLLNLPSKSAFKNSTGEALNNFKTIFSLRYAHMERFIEDNFFRTSFGSDLPIVELNYTHGFPNILKSSYQYDRLDISVSDYLKLAPYGSLSYNIFAGKIFGTLPYQLLEIHPGNEYYYYNRYAFNLMKRYEYVSDRYVGATIEHNIGNGLFRFIPLTRKLKFRQFWNIKTLMGDLSPANQKLNFVDNYPFKSLDGKLYTEVGTGIDNIFKFFRIDFVWRVSPNSLPAQLPSHFGLFGSFRVSF